MTARRISVTLPEWAWRQVVEALQYDSDPEVEADNRRLAVAIQEQTR